MSDYTLFDAVRAELRARRTLIRTSAGMTSALEALAGAMRGFRASIEASPELAQVECAQRQLLADLLTLELFVEELGDQVTEHRNRLASSFGAPGAR
ncbi:hypothetical protein [Acidiphilium sp.]|uniref:hypothetical protein n=1 Tax=Acidiphilium sp. TaxID=527 RepID=UPI003D0581D5